MVGAVQRVHGTVREVQRVCGMVGVVQRVCGMVGAVEMKVLYVAPSTHGKHGRNWSSNLVQPDSHVHVMHAVTMRVRKTSLMMQGRRLPDLHTWRALAVFISLLWYDLTATWIPLRMATQCNTAERCPSPTCSMISKSSMVLQSEVAMAYCHELGPCLVI